MEDILLRDGYHDLLGGFRVEDKNQEAIKKYQLNICSIYRARGAYLLETDRGSKLLKPYHGSVNRANFEHTVKEHLKSNGYPNVDCFVKTANGSVVAEDGAGNLFTMRDWYSGDECNLKDIYQIEEAIRHLARIHQCLTNVELTPEQVSFNQAVNLNDLFDKRNRELKRVRAYIRDKKQRNEFEINYINYYDTFYQAGVSALQLLRESEYERLQKEAVDNCCICHGSFSYHNILMREQISQERHATREEEMELAAASLHAPEYQVAVTNFDKAYVGIQISDLYQFIRKAMEKNGWDLLYGSRMIEAYDRVKPLQKEELKLLYILLLYPEKFWKITNYYFNGKKSWVSERNIQKLMSVGEQNSKKEIFLEKLAGIL